MRCLRFRSRRVTHAFGAALAVALLLPANGWAKPHARHAARDQVIALENLWVKAQIQDDPGAMEKLLSPDYLGITASGEVLTKSQQLDHMRNRTVTVHSLQISDVRVKLLGQAAASVTSLAQLNATLEGQPIIGRFRYTHVYQKLANGVWRLTNVEATRIPQRGSAAGSGISAPATEPPANR